MCIACLNNEKYATFNITHFHFRIFGRVAPLRWLQEELAELGLGRWVRRSRLGEDRIRRGLARRLLLRRFQGLGLLRLEVVDGAEDLDLSPLLIAADLLGALLQ